MSNVEIYQLFPHSGYLMHSYLVKTPNGKIVVVDGGNVRYMKDAYLPFAIRGVLGLGENDYFEIEAWFISHAHDDHYGEFIMMMREYDQKSNYKVNNFYFDFPDFEKGKYPFHDVDATSMQELKDSFQKYATVNGIPSENYYDELNGRLINKESVQKGLTVSIDGVDFDILQTWSDDDDQVNGNSLVIRVSESNKYGRTFLLLNDLSPKCGLRLVKRYGNTLKSDIVQLAHHGQGGCEKEVYDVIDADLRLWPTPSWVWAKPQYKTAQTREWFGVDMENPNKERDFVGCKYEKYPENHRSVDDWKDCLDGMKIVL